MGASSAEGVTNGRGRVVQQLPELCLTHASLSSSTVLVSILWLYLQLCLFVSLNLLSCFRFQVSYFGFTTMRYWGDRGGNDIFVGAAVYSYVRERIMKTVIYACTVPLQTSYVCNYSLPSRSLPYSDGHRYHWSPTSCSGVSTNQVKKLLTQPYLMNDKREDMRELRQNDLIPQKRRWREGITSTEETEVRW